MKLQEMTGFDRDGNPTTIWLPAYHIVKQALLDLDYSSGAIENQDAAHQLAEQFYLSAKQRNVVKENGVNLWIRQVNISIQHLVDEGKLLRPKFATIITTDRFGDIVVDALEQLNCDIPEFFVNRNRDTRTTLIKVETDYLNFSLAFRKPDSVVSDDLDTD